MKLGDVLRKERERKNLTAEKVAADLGLPTEQYLELEKGESPIEEWGPKLGTIAINLSTPTSRLISETGKSAQAKQSEEQCGRLIRGHRERRNLSREELASELGISEDEIATIESGKSPIEIYAPLLLKFAEIVNQPIFNLFYPCGLPVGKLQDYP
jgi:transcriptional regulator with XRE-family HTH domain